ncbi:MAG TPA: hypothetical protein VLE23_05470 [Geminicoccaceae bacterium]|nr:hypothetical protein [Geminicoccaceae bacterium]
MVARAFERDSLFSLIAGPLVWTAHFLTLYVFTAIACAHGFFDRDILGVRVVPLVGGAVTLLAVALILDALVLSYRRWQGKPWDGGSEPLPPHDRNDAASRRRFMAYAGLLLSGIALIATIWETLPIVFFSTCR